MHKTFRVFRWPKLSHLFFVNKKKYDYERLFSTYSILTFRTDAGRTSSLSEPNRVARTRLKKKENNWKDVDSRNHILSNKKKSFFFFIPPLPSIPQPPCDPSNPKDLFVPTRSIPAPKTPRKKKKEKWGEKEEKQNGNINGCAKPRVSFQPKLVFYERLLWEIRGFEPVRSDRWLT